MLQYSPIKSALNSLISQKKAKMKQFIISPKTFPILKKLLNLWRGRIKLDRSDDRCAPLHLFV